MRPNKIKRRKSIKALTYVPLEDLQRRSEKNHKRSTYKEKWRLKNENLKKVKNFLGFDRFKLKGKKKDTNHFD